MKKIYFLTLISTTLSFTNAKAQAYSQGDIDMVVQPIMQHDTTQCGTGCQLFYSLTIHNSFLGDSVKVKDMFSGAIIFEAENNLGTNPWYTDVFVYNGSGFVPDDQLVGGVAYFGNGSTNKVISGTDTIYNIVNNAFLPVSNPCLYSTVSGRVYVDYDNDCAFNNSDVPLSGLGITLNENLNSPAMTTTSYYGGTDGMGDYSVTALQSWMTDYNVNILGIYQFIFPSSSCSPIPTFTSTALPQSNINFSLQCTSLMDVQCYAGSWGVVRPMQPFYMSPYVSNTGCNPASGTLKFVLDPNVTYNSSLSTNPATTVSSDTLIWNYSNLSNLSNGAYWNSFFAGVHLTPTASVTTGDTLCFRVFTNVPAGDINAGNNDYTICLPVVNSHDPNLKEVSPKGIGATGEVPATTDELTYTIHFQNTGTASAFNVRVIDTLDANIDASTLHIIGTDHTMSPEWLGSNIVHFNFYNINLIDSLHNEPKSHGYIRFSVKLRNALPVGTAIKNKAAIYFDFNPAIVTNEVTTTLGITTGIDKQGNGDVVSVYPNPSTGKFQVSSIKSKAQSIKIYNVLGECVYQSEIKIPKSEIDLTTQPSGMYFYKVTSADSKVSSGKLIKE